MKTQLQILLERLKEFFPKMEIPTMLTLIVMIVIGIIYNINKEITPEKPYFCPTCGQPTKIKHERFIF